VAPAGRAAPLNREEHLVSFGRYRSSRAPYRPVNPGPAFHYERLGFTTSRSPRVHIAPIWNTFRSERPTVATDAYRRLSEGLADKALVRKGFCVVDMSSTRSPSGRESLSQVVLVPRLNRRGDGAAGGELAVARYLTLVWTACCLDGQFASPDRPRAERVAIKVDFALRWSCPGSTRLMPGSTWSHLLTQLDLSVTSSTSKTLLQIRRPGAPQIGPKHPRHLHQRRPHTPFR
jgi:hypothetical protein